MKEKTTNKGGENMKSLIVANDGNTTNTYKYNKMVLQELKKLDFPCVVLGKLTGKTYNEKQNEIEEKARELQCIDIGGLSWGELSEIQVYFETYGKRYGLLTEFRENCII